MKFVSLFLLLLLSVNVAAELAPIGGVDVRAANEITIRVKANKVIREQMPEEIFGFNINFKSFQNQLWDDSGHRVYPKVTEHLKEFSPAVFRYPGGLVANSFAWDEAVGPLASRGLQDTIFKAPPKKARFGLDEYLRFIDQVGGEFLYVLNIVGTNALQPLKEAPIKDISEKNKALAEYLVNKMGSQQRYYQLGNELDRSKYEWSPEKYGQRARAAADAIRSVDKDAEFIAFMRDFTWTYKQDKSRGTSTPDSYMKTVMEQLPEVTNYSLHHYYNGKRKDHRSRAITFWLRHLKMSIRDYQDLRGEDPKIWITEHGRQMSSTKPAKDLTVQYTSNLGGALSTADYLIAIAQIPQIRGAVWHALNAGPWQMFDATVRYKDLRPRPIYYGYRVLREMDLPTVLDTRIASTNISGNQSGYDVRAVGFSDADQQQLGLWLVNHSVVPREVSVEFKPLASKPVNIAQWYISGPEGVDVDDLSMQFKDGVQTKQVAGAFTDAGTIKLVIPPSSVSTFKVTPSL